jgi:hypothetical protein
MTETKNIEQIIEDIAIAYTNAGTEWVRIEDIATASGLTARQLAEGIKDLVANDETFRAEPQPHNERITDWDRANAPVIGGEARHQITWE